MGRKSMPKITSLLALIVVMTTATADDVEDRAAVMQVIDAFFVSMTAKDIDGMRQIMATDGVLHGYRETGEGDKMFSITHADYLQNLADSEGVPVERIWNPDINIRDRIAIVWTPYDFHNNGVFSHCGVNTFSMIKDEDSWIITGVVFSVRSEDCEESPLGPLNSGKPAA